jgi:ligand-binding SRPBCC domain-containing protein
MTKTARSRYCDRIRRTRAAMSRGVSPAVSSIRILVSSGISFSAASSNFFFSSASGEIPKGGGNSWEACVWLSAVSTARHFHSSFPLARLLAPPWLGFRMLTPGPIRMSAGTRISHRLSWRGIPVGWTTEIRRWEPSSCFVDVQLSGPYRLWHHTHRFESKDGGTRMTDVVRYRLPFGPIGRAAHALKVRRDLERIFDYRFHRINELLSTAGLVEAR